MSSCAIIFHLALELTEPNLSEGMRWLQATWARRHNNYRKIVGNHSRAVSKLSLSNMVIVWPKSATYIHLNPVRAGMKSSTQLSRYPWSSLAKFPHRSRPSWLVGSTVLQQAGDLNDSAHGWRSTAEYLQFSRCR